MHNFKKSSNEIKPEQSLEENQKTSKQRQKKAKTTKQEKDVSNIPRSSLNCAHNFKCRNESDTIMKIKEVSS